MPISSAGRDSACNIKCVVLYTVVEEAEEYAESIYAPLHAEEEGFNRCGTGMTEYPTTATTLDEVEWYSNERIWYEAWNYPYDRIVFMAFECFKRSTLKYPGGFTLIKTYSPHCERRLARVEVCYLAHRIISTSGQ